MLFCESSLIIICYILNMKLTASKIQIQKQTYSLSLEKSIAMLILPHTELTASIEQELQNNPLLEAEFETLPAEKPMDLEQISAVINLSSPAIHGPATEEEREFESSSIENTMTLEDHLFHQLFLGNF